VPWLYCGKFFKKHRRKVLTRGDEGGILSKLSRAKSADQTETVEKK